MRATYPVRSLKSWLPSIALLAIALTSSNAFAQGNIGSLDDRSSPGGYTTVTIGGTVWGKYTAQAGASTDSLDPRVERRLEPRIDTGNGNYTFEARYNIEAADDTTIAQILNAAPTSSDPYKPVVFVKVFSDGSRWKISNKGVTLGYVNKNTSSSRPTFVMKIVSDGDSSKIYLNGSLKGNFVHERVGRDSQMRYGNYHHGSGTARILIRDVTFDAP